MTERTLTVQREETMDVCDVCGREADAYDAPGQFDAYWPSDPNRRSEIDGQLHFHERCLADVEGMSMPRDHYDGFRFWNHNKHHTRDIRGVVLPWDMTYVPMSVAVLAASSFVLGTGWSVPSWTIFPAIIAFILSMLVVSATMLVRWRNLAEAVREELDQ